MGWRRLADDGEPAHERFRAVGCVDRGSNEVDSRGKVRPQIALTSRTIRDNVLILIGAYGVRRE